MDVGENQEPVISTVQPLTSLDDGRGHVFHRQDCTPDGFSWLRLHKLQYEDHLGRRFAWEAVKRSTRPAAAATGEQSGDGVAVLAKIVSRSGPTQVPVVVQFRPPLECVVIELPAGLVERGQSAEETALRELLEETGYRGRVSSVSVPLAESAGITDSCCQLALVEVDGDAPENAAARPSPEAGEILHCELLPYDSLLDSLLQLRGRQEAAVPRGSHSSSSRKCVIDSRLYALALGLQLERGASRVRDGMPPLGASPVPPHTMASPEGAAAAASAPTLEAEGIDKRRNGTEEAERAEGSGQRGCMRDSSLRQCQTGVHCASQHRPVDAAGGDCSAAAAAEGEGSSATAGCPSASTASVSEHQARRAVASSSGLVAGGARAIRDRPRDGGAGVSGGADDEGADDEGADDGGADDGGADDGGADVSSAGRSSCGGPVPRFDEGCAHHPQSPAAAAAAGPLADCWRAAFLEQLSGLSEVEIQAILSDRDPDLDAPTWGSTDVQPGPAAPPPPEVPGLPEGGVASSSGCDRAPGSAPGGQLPVGEHSNGGCDDGRRQGRGGGRRGRWQRRGGNNRHGAGGGGGAADAGGSAGTQLVVTYAPKRRGRSTVGGGGRKGFAGSNAGPPPRRWGRPQVAYGLVAATSAARRLLSVRGWVGWAASDPVALGCCAVVCGVTLSAGGLALRAWWRGAA